MTDRSSRIGTAPQPLKVLNQAAVLICFLLVFSTVAFAQTPATKNESPNSPPADTRKSTEAKAPLAEDERTELLQLIRKLQERVDKLEAAKKQPDSTHPNI